MSVLRRHLIEALAALRRDEREQERKAASRSTPARLDVPEGAPLRPLMLRHQAAVRRRLACQEQIMQMLGDAESGDALCCLAADRCAHDSIAKPQSDDPAREGASALSRLDELQRDLAALTVGYRNLAQLADILAMAPISGLLARLRADLDQMSTEAERLQLDIALDVMRFDMMRFDRAKAGQTGPAFPKRRNERCCV